MRILPIKAGWWFKHILNLLSYRLLSELTGILCDGRTPQPSHMQIWAVPRIEVKLRFATKYLNPGEAMWSVATEISPDICWHAKSKFIFIRPLHCFQLLGAMSSNLIPLSDAHQTQLMSGGERGCAHSHRCGVRIFETRKPMDHRNGVNILTSLFWSTLACYNSN